MNNTELLTELKKLLTVNGDVEADHAKADKLLIEFINDVQITNTYNQIKKWYS